MDIAKKVQAAYAKASESEKEHALKDATKFIDTQFKYRGEPETRMQALSWPRKNAFFDDGTPIRGVPDAIKNATSHLAGFMLADIPMNQETMAEIISILMPVMEKERLN